MFVWLSTRWSLYCSYSSRALAYLPRQGLGKIYFTNYSRLKGQFQRRKPFSEKKTRGGCVLNGLPMFNNPTLKDTFLISDAVVILCGFVELPLASEVSCHLFVLPLFSCFDEYFLSLSYSVSHSCEHKQRLGHIRELVRVEDTVLVLAPVSALRIISNTMNADNLAGFNLLRTLRFARIIRAWAATDLVAHIVICLDPTFL